MQLYRCISFSPKFKYFTILMIIKVIHSIYEQNQIIQRGNKNHSKVHSSGQTNKQTNTENYERNVLPNVFSSHGYALTHREVYAVLCKCTVHSVFSNLLFFTQLCQYRFTSLTLMIVWLSFPSLDKHFTSFLLKCFRT